MGASFYFPIYDEILLDSSKLDAVAEMGARLVGCDHAI
jgi:hypothetical protein